MYTKTKVWAYTIRGGGQFPLDMLRYDQCWPETNEDVAVMHRSIEDTYEVWTLRMNSIKLPTIARWASFVCKVSAIEED